MPLVKVPVHELRPGMFVAELDRPWLDTPFALQGFMVRNESEVLYVGEHVDYVYVDTSYGGGPQYLPVQLMAKSKVSEEINIKAEFQQAKISFESASESLDRVFKTLERGDRADIAVVREAVKPLVDGVLRNKDAVAALVRLREVGDYRYHHGIAMAVWAAILGKHIGLHRSQLEILVVGCAMCDVGMSSVPRDVLESLDPLTDAQVEQIRGHTAHGLEMVSGAENLDPDIQSIIAHHHERHNGSGYPQGLKGSQIPLMARIAGLVDAYDAMITPKPYAPARSSFEAIQELMEVKDELFQGVLVEQLVQAVGLFPTGSLVELNTGELGLVVRQNEARRLKPEVVIVADKNKETLQNLEFVDLSGQGPLERRWISRELPPGTYNINREDYFL